MVVDDRLPGDSELRMKRYRCTVPGCGKTARSVGTPVCPKHRLPMEPSSGSGR